MADGDALYYVISDLHIGGDEQLEHVDFEEELLSFLRDLEEKGGERNVELVINGDAFGLWEITSVDGPAKFDVLVERYPEIFAQLRRTGESIDITLLPGNHDHELAAHEEYAERFDEHNVTVAQRESITRPVGERRVWFEHGHQRDPNNRFDDFGNPYDRPLGYYFNTLVTSHAGRVSERGRSNWLKDIQAVTPTKRVPTWFFSKYFYHEMNPLMRYTAVPFLLLFNVSVLMAVLVGLDIVGMWNVPTTVARDLFGSLGYVGDVLSLVLAVNVAIAGLLALTWASLHFVLRDFRKTVDRFDLVETGFTRDTSGAYDSAARDVFASHPDVAVYCYGHTHRPEVRRLDDRLVVNTGTWLKRLHRRDAVAGLLPPIFYPSYRLSVIRIEAVGGEVVVDYDAIDAPDPAPTDLTLTERLLTVGREPDPDIPERMTVGAEWGPTDGA